MKNAPIQRLLCLGLLWFVGCGGSAERDEPVIETLDAEADALAAEQAEENRLLTLQLTTVMDGLLGTHEEYKAAQQHGNLNHDGGYPIDWEQIPNQALSSSERFVFGIRTVDSANTVMLAVLHENGPELFSAMFADRDGDGTEEIYDPWGNEIEYRALNDGMGAGPMTGVANALLPLSPWPFFVSAGPDGVFGPGARGNNDDITTVHEPIYRD